MTADFLMEFTDNRYKGEEQVIKALKAKQKYSDDVSGDTFRLKAEQRLFTQKQMLWSEIKRRAAINPAWQWHRADALDRLKEDCVHKDIWREAGGYVEKGPFPLPDTHVKVQVLARDDNTGRCKLRVNPINADVVYVEVGGVATSASQLLPGRDYETDALEVSFLAVDSSGKHNTGKAVAWRNTITLKSRLYQAGDDKMLELHAAPAAAIRYSTEGSDPKMFGATYEAPFVVPSGTRLVLAVGEKNGIQSDVLRIDVDWSRRPEEKPIDKDAPATWRPVDGVAFKDTRTAYGFMARLVKFGGETSGLHIQVLGQRWVDLSFEDSIRLGGARMEQEVEQLRGLLEEGQVTIEARALHFPTGAQLLDYVEDIKAQLPRNEVEP
jgi:hypothetical protein